MQKKYFYFFPNLKLPFIFILKIFTSPFSLPTLFFPSYLVLYFILIFPISFILSSLVFPSSLKASSKSLYSNLRVNVFHNGKVKGIPIEEYIRGVLEAEIPISWDIEVLKAQAVVSRSYTIYLLKEEGRKFLKASVINQLWREPESLKSKTAVQETAGWVLVFPNSEKVAPGFFHSTCGGYTENAWEVWGGDPDLKHIKGVKCGKCYESPYFFWRRVAKLKDFIGNLKKLSDPISLAINENTWISENKFSVERSSSGRIIHIVVKYKGSDFLYISGEDLRNALGLPSAFFNFEILGSKSEVLDSLKIFDLENLKDEEIIFYGRGFGHGVGLCQWGAKKLAEEGKNWKEILKFYFPYLELKKIY